MYVYQLTIRPSDPFTTPDGPGRRYLDKNLPAYAKRDYGQVGYDFPLPVDEIDHYALRPVTEAQALNGHRYGAPLSADRTAIYTISVDENAVILAQGRVGTRGEADYVEHDQYMHFTDVAKKVASGQWQKLE